MSHRALQLFRAWVPSWRFFETLSQQPVLFYRVAANESVESSAWRCALQRPSRQWYSFVLNGEGNLHLASYTLLDQLEEDIGELSTAQIEALPQTPSYQLVQNLVIFLLRERNELIGGCRYQFKISRQLLHSAEAFEDILVSPVYIHAQS